jgi:hypothetical protein
MQIERLLQLTLRRCVQVLARHISFYRPLLIGYNAATRRWFPASVNAVDREEIRPVHADSLQTLTTGGRTVVEIATLHW